MMLDDVTGDSQKQSCTPAQTETMATQEPHQELELGPGIEGDFDEPKTVLADNKEILKKHTTFRSDGPACREILDDIRRTTFLLEDKHECMQKLRDHLTKLRADLFKSVPRERGIPLRRDDKKLSRQSKGESTGKMKQFRSLPRKKRKVTFAGRVGEKKEKMLKAMNVNINEEENTNVIETEIITYVDETENFYVKNTSDGHSKDESYSDSSDMTIHTEQNLAVNQLKVHVSKDKVLLEEIKKIRHERSRRSMEQESSLSLNSVHEPLRQHITAGDLRNVGHKKCLTGNLIVVIQKLLKDQYPDVGGLQDPLCGVRLRFRVCKEKPFVQILHDGSYHWVAISTVNCKPGEVIYMDSLFTGKITQDIQRQICSIVRHEQETLSVKVIPVQQQKGSVDCGLFAMAFIQYILLNKEYPSAVTFDQFVMRHHVLRALAANYLEPFPVINGTAKRNAEKTIKIELYCNCRLPWFPSDGSKVNRYKFIFRSYIL